MGNDLALPCEQIENFIQEMYRYYPKKLGKTNGLKKLRKQLKTETDCRDFATAMAKFITYHQQHETEPQYICMFSTFISTWMDWLDEDAGVVLAKEEKDLFALIRNS